MVYALIVVPEKKVEPLSLVGIEGNASIGNQPLDLRFCRKRQRSVQSHHIITGKDVRKVVLVRP